ncbi:MAG: secondary thiamine-phosphate synthase enzyme YjbQ [Planctomycetota bacterium]
MTIFREQLVLRTRGETDIIDVTGHARRVVAASGMMIGTVHLFTPGATAGLSTIEYEEGCIHDLKEAFERIAPRDGHYDHNERWGDGNGFSHVRAALLGPSLNVPLENGELVLGTWQQLILVDFDNKPRERRLLVTVSGDG